MAVTDQPSRQEHEAATSRRPGRTHRQTPVRRPVLMLPLALLIIVGLAGLRGQVSGLRWDGPWHRHALAVGLALEVLLATMLLITIRRQAGRGPARAGGTGPSGVVVKLRWVLVTVLSAGMIAVGATLLVGLHQRVFSGPGGTRPAPAASAQPGRSPSRSGWHFFFTLHLHVPAVVLYVLIGLIFLGAIALRMWWVRKFRWSGPARRLRSIAEESKELREAVESGRSALRAIDEARAAIIACYLAMEASLAERGTARGIADTPNELLARFTATGIAGGTAAARLTALFYEARFSTHPLERGPRDAAEQALGELAVALAEAETAAIQASRGRANRSGPDRSGGRSGRSRGRRSRPGRSSGIPRSARSGASA